VVERLELKQVVRREMESYSMEQRNCFELNFGVGEQHYDEVSVASRGLLLGK
jgi:hypothetical protein